MKFCELRVDAKNNFTPPLQPPHRHTGILCTMTRLELLLKLCTMTIIIKTSLSTTTQRKVYAIHYVLLKDVILTLLVL